MPGLPCRFDDGGRAAAGFRGHTGDCAVRAVAIGTGYPYKMVYRIFHDQMRANPHLVARGKASPRHGVPLPLIKWLLVYELGWSWTPTMHIGSGCTVHLAPGEVPMSGPVVARVTRHIVAVVNGVVHDTGDPCRDGTRCVYGWWVPGN